MEKEPGVIRVDNPQKLGHRLPDENDHGLVLPTYSRTLLVGGVSSGKTLCALNILAQCHRKWPVQKVFLMSPNNAEVARGEWGLVDVECLEHWPALEFWNNQPPRCVLICDDVSWALSTKGSPSQAELAERTLGHICSHHGGNDKETHKKGKKAQPSGLQIIACQQTWTAIKPCYRRLFSHFCFFPKRIDRSTLGHIARGVMIEKKSLGTCFDFCHEPHDFLLVSNIPDGRARVRLNGYRSILGLL